MRKLTLALLAMPVLVMVYVVSLLRASSLARVGLAIGLGAVVGFGVLAAVRPVETTANPPTVSVPLTQAAFRTTVATGVSVVAPATIEFSVPMDRASVESVLRVDPSVPVTLTWAPDGRSVTISPVTHWTVGAYHTITVEPGALALTGRPLTTPARTSFVVRAAAVAVLGASDVVGKRVATGTAFSIAVDSAVKPASLAGSIRLDPPVDGVVTLEPSMDGGTRILFTPTAPLAADQRYRLTVDGVRDADGVAVAPATLEVRTVASPAVVRFRPAAGAQDVPRDQAISVRFTRPMDRVTTASAFRVTADDQVVEGTVEFTDDDTVLVFTPSARLPYDARIVATVAATATSTEGANLPPEPSAAFRTVEKPKPEPTPAPKPEPTPTPKPRSTSSGSGGGTVASGNWAAVERYYLGLMNCTRTGGLVTSSGGCSSPGGRNVAPLSLSSGISSKVSRPYAKLLATKNLCSHFVGGGPGDRLREAGYTNYTWAENLGCRSGNAKDAVLASHLYFQSERDWSPQGGHYVNLMNAKYDRVGIGVWVASGRVRLVVNFYRP